MLTLSGHASETLCWVGSLLCLQDQGAPGPGPPLQSRERPQAVAEGRGSEPGGRETESPGK